MEAELRKINRRERVRKGQAMRFLGHCSPNIHSVYAAAHPSSVVNSQASDLAGARTEAKEFLARQDAGFIGWPPKPKNPREVLMLACYVNECRERRELHLADASILTERIRRLCRFLKRTDPMVQLANRSVGSS